MMVLFVRIMFVWQGAIPSTIGMLTSLLTLNLSYNCLEASRSRKLANCGLSGTIPSTVALLTNLKQLLLAGNSIVGIPDGVDPPASLQTIDLSSNFPPSGLSAFIGNFTNVPISVHLIFGSNLGGTIPDSIQFMTRWQDINFANYGLRGTIPSVLGALTNLQSIDMSSNSLEVWQLVNKIFEFVCPNNKFCLIIH